MSHRCVIDDDYRIRSRGAIRCQQPKQWYPHAQMCILHTTSPIFRKSCGNFLWQSSQLVEQAWGSKHGASLSSSSSCGTGAWSMQSPAHSGETRDIFAVTLNGTAIA